MNRYFFFAFVASSMALFSACDDDDDDSFTVFGGSYTTSNEQLAGPPVVQIRITGLGDMENLGPGKFVAYSTQNLTPPPPFTMSGIATSSFDDHDDVFYTSFNGTIRPNGDGTNTIVVNHVIRGGTGRFENATGSYTGTSKVDLAQPTNTLNVEGRIKY